ncbi:hypothetical protein K0M31_016686 [Melipona bicolor]|uniref:Uncharacterized protein n=1 Tax=Melipona bicolor TaxID=60889 RepID=A0AA40FED9_9HYME|nr:hypothetical protein K0M31_016686 [Melipona bicolor]
MRARSRSKLSVCTSKGGVGVDFLEGVTGVRIFQASGSSTTPEVFGGFVVPLFRYETCFFLVRCASAPLFPEMESGRRGTCEYQSALLLEVFKALWISRRSKVYHDEGKMDSLVLATGPPEKHRLLA